jgi:hypothetical protein
MFIDKQCNVALHHQFFFFFFSFFTIYEQLMICLLGQLDYYSSEKVQYRHAGTRIFNGIAFCSIWPRNNLQVPYHQWHKKTLSFPYESLSPPLTVSHFAHLKTLSFTNYSLPCGSCYAGGKNKPLLHKSYASCCLLLKHSYYLI